MTLRIKLMAVLLSVSIASIATTSYVTFLSSKRFFTKSTIGSLEGLAKIKSKAIDNLLNDRVYQIEHIATYPAIISDVANIANRKRGQEMDDSGVHSFQPKKIIENQGLQSQAEPNEGETKVDVNAVKEKGIFEEVKLPHDNVETKKELEESPEYQSLSKLLAKIAGNGKKYEEIFILDTSGIVLVSTVLENEGKSAANAQFFVTGAKTTFIQDIFVSEITKKLSMVIATPIKDENGKAVGVLGARLNLDLLYELVRDETGLGETGETIVGKRDEDSVVFTSPTRYDDKAALQRKVPVGSKLEYPLQEASRGNSGYGLFKDYRGVDTLSVWQRIPSLNWGLVVKMDAIEALKPIVNARNRIEVLAVSLILLVIVLSHVVSKRIVKPIQQLMQAADNISRGSMDVKIDVKSSDEVGDLAESFERMLASIKFLKDKNTEQR